ncbi:MAG TPA: sigma-70 family RNA polymerase sigma factor [Niabella sp.]|nr:sigma-70 family RNA polymerase sigma factor [Niabella sp.]HRB28348.1 sigma-70 family RNA polymerase sigma factor [Niabella sp.]HRB60803.1 sigma-70 family RNA polymerase sigma factor [Niabella sp.]HRB65733.1 sigma-70 family RNA polymerase sigma factor [Niabella sp.]HRB78898.1 sigma-70 family RNA polymerase sigma factor [Niabella sp.]
MEGDQNMFLSLYNKFYHSLLFMGLKKSKDSELVKDCIQQLFLQLWEKRETIQPARDVKAYLVISFLRRLSLDIRKGYHIDQYDEYNKSHDEILSDTPEEYLIHKHDQANISATLKSLISTLPERQKELIVLRFYEGLSYEEIVTRTGLTQRTVYNKIYEALKKLKLSAETIQQSELISFLFLTL